MSSNSLEIPVEVIHQHIEEFISSCLYYMWTSLIVWTNRYTWCLYSCIMLLIDRHGDANSTCAIHVQYIICLWCWGCEDTFVCNNNSSNSVGLFELMFSFVVKMFHWTNHNIYLLTLVEVDFVAYTKDLSVLTGFFAALLFAAVSSLCLFFSIISQRF